MSPDPPAVYWCARTGELATNYTAGMVYLDEHHRPPDDAVRLVPDGARHEVACPTCGATIRARMADAPAEGAAPPGIDWRAAYEETVGPAARAQCLDDRVAAPTRDDIARAIHVALHHPDGDPDMPCRIEYPTRFTFCDGPRARDQDAADAVRALLGGADNDNEGER